MAEYIGLTRSSYAQYELGNRTPDAHTLYAIAKFYKISIDLLFEPDLSKFLSEMTYSQIDGDNSQLLIDNFRQLSPFNKGRLVEYSQKLLEWDKIKEQNQKELEKRRQIIPRLAALCTLKQNINLSSDIPGRKSHQHPYS